MTVIFYNPDHSTWLGHRLENSGVHPIFFYRSASVKFSLPPISFRTRLTRKHDEWEEKSVMTVMPETSELGEKPRQHRDLRLRLRLQQKLPICLPLSWMNKRKSNNNNSSSNNISSNKNNSTNNKNNSSPRCSIQKT